MRLDKSINSATKIMKIIRETIVAGKTILQRYYGSSRITTEKGRKRAPKSNPTSEAVRKVNLRNAVRNLTAILNHNFSSCDYSLTLTYDTVPTKAEAKKNLQNFMRKMKYYCQKNEMQWKWIAVTEYENHRIHHHVVCSGIDPKVIADKWTYGFVKFSAMDESGNYSRLAEYLIKETEKTFRRDDSVNKKRYTGSKNIVIPEAKREAVSERMLNVDPEPYKGYYIFEGRVDRYEHAILGIECMEFIQISLDEDPRLKKWKRGKKSKTEKHYKEMWSSQIGLEEILYEQKRS